MKTFPTLPTTLQYCQPEACVFPITPRGYVSFLIYLVLVSLMVGSLVVDKILLVATTSFQSFIELKFPFVCEVILCLEAESEDEMS